MIQPDQMINLAEGISVQHLGEDEGAVVLMLASGQLYTCNDTTAEVLRTVARNATFAEIVAALFAQFEVGEEELRQDVAAILDELAREGIVRIR